MIKELKRSYAVYLIFPKELYIPLICFSTIAIIVCIILIVFMFLKLRSQLDKPKRTSDSTIYTEIKDRQSHHFYSNIDDLDLDELKKKNTSKVS